MATNDPIPFRFKCDARWDDMLGNGRKRLCTQCNTPVIDLSSMSEQEAKAVVAKGGVCVNYIVRGGEVVYNRRDGRADPRGASQRQDARDRSRRYRLLHLAAASAAATAAALPGAAFAGQHAQDGPIERLRDWVSSFFEVEVGGELVPIPEERLGGAIPAPPSLVVDVPGSTHVDAVCNDELVTTAQSNAEGRTSLWLYGMSDCEVVVRGGVHDGLRTSLPETRIDDTTCSVQDTTLVCR